MISLARCQRALGTPFSGCLLSAFFAGSKMLDARLRKGSQILAKPNNEGTEP